MQREYLICIYAYSQNQKAYEPISELLARAYGSGRTDK